MPFKTTGVPPLDARYVAPLPNASLIGGIPITYTVDLSPGGTADYNYLLLHKTTILGARLILMGAGVAGSSMQIKYGANAITEAMATTGADTAIVEATTINDANNTIAAGGQLRISAVAATTIPRTMTVITGVRSV